jgi:hypothetical protein
MYRTVHFTTSRADDAKFDEAGEPIGVGHRALAEHLREAISKGVTATTPVEQHSYYGWRFDVTFERCSFETVLNPIHPDCHLTITLPGVLLWRLLQRRPHEAFTHYCALVEAVLKRMTDLRQIAWE